MSHPILRRTMMSAEGEFGTRAGHIQYFQFGTVPPVSGPSNANDNPGDTVSMRNNESHWNGLRMRLSHGPLINWGARQKLTLIGRKLFPN